MEPVPVEQNSSISSSEWNDPFGKEKPEIKLDVEIGKVCFKGKYVALIRPFEAYAEKSQR